MLKNKNDRLKPKPIERKESPINSKENYRLNDEQKAQIKNAVDELKELQKSLDDHPEAKAMMGYLSDLLGDKGDFKVNESFNKTGVETDHRDKLRMTSEEARNYSNIGMEKGPSVNRIQNMLIYQKNQEKNPFVRTDYDFESTSTAINFLFSLDGAGFKSELKYIPYGSQMSFHTEARKDKTAQGIRLFGGQRIKPEEDNEDNNENKVITEVIFPSKVEASEENPTTAKQYLHPKNPFLANNAIRDWFKEYMKISEEDEERISFLNEVLK